MLYIIAILFGSFFGIFCYKHPRLGKIILGSQVGLIGGLILFSLIFYMIETYPDNVFFFLNFNI